MSTVTPLQEPARYQLQLRARLADRQQNYQGIELSEELDIEAEGFGELAHILAAFHETAAAVKAARGHGQDQDQAEPTVLGRLAVRLDPTGRVGVDAAALSALVRKAASTLGATTGELLDELLAP